MADTSDAAKGGNAAAATNSGDAAAGEAQAAPRLAIVSQYIRDLSFENPRGSNIGKSGASRPEIQVRVDVRPKPAGEGAFEIELEMNVDAKADNEQVFVLELTYCGVFNLANIPDNALQALLMIECPRILFPFARRIVSDVTRDGGFPPLNLDNIDFVALYRQQLAQQQQAAAAENAPAN